MNRFDVDALRSRLSHVYWLGGSPCCGKSTISDLIRDRYDVQVVHVDEAVRDKYSQFRPDTQPCLHRWTSSSWDDLWARPVDVLLEEVFRCYKEQFDIILADLLELQPNSPILVEGNSLLPSKMAPLVQAKSHALWMVPTEEFQRREYPRRGAWVKAILDQCSDPGQALKNWMDRDVAFAARIADQVRCSGFTLLTVDGTRPIEQNMQLVVERFGFESGGRG